MHEPDNVGAATSRRQRKAGDRRSAEWFDRTTSTASALARTCCSRVSTPRRSATGPIIGICNTWSELSGCNAHLRSLAEHVKRGVIRAGGFPLEFPVISLGEPLMRPTTMLYRNLVAMDVEETIRANPIDGVVLLTGCDKTTPATIMGACSANIPAIVVTGGPMLNGHLRRLGDRLLHRLLALPRGAAGRAHRPAPVPGDRGRHVPLGRTLHDHGHGDHDGVRDRGARHVPARVGSDPCRRLASSHVAEASGSQIVELVRWASRLRTS